MNREVKDVYPNSGILFGRNGKVVSEFQGKYLLLDFTET